MDKTFDVTPREAEEIKQEIQKCLDEMKLSFARMDKDQKEIDRLGVSTRATLEQLKTI